MTKQDYEALAALLKAHRKCNEPEHASAVRDHLDQLAYDMAQYLSRNPHFDQAKFLEAAGVP
jgi:hypothetical protein